MIRKHFGTGRGAVRLGLSYIQVALGTARTTRLDADATERLIFVCQGNICRSAFAEAVARDLGLKTMSFGLSTSAGLPAHPPAVSAACELGYDLSSHTTLPAAQYGPREGDLLLAMEVRQLARLAVNSHLRHVPRSLLGEWARPRTPHLHDPFRLSDDYMHNCFIRIQSAVTNLAGDFPGSRVL